MVFFSRQQATYVEVPAAGSNIAVYGLAHVNRTVQITRNITNDYRWPR